MKKKRLLFIIFLLFGGNYIYSQNPDITLPNIYKDVLPGLKSDQVNTNSSQQDPKNVDQEKQNNMTNEGNQQKQSILLSIKNLLSNKTMMNIIILIIIFAIFFIYRIRKN